MICVVQFIAAWITATFLIFIAAAAIFLAISFIAWSPPELDKLFSLTTIRICMVGALFIAYGAMKQVAK